MGQRGNGLLVGALGCGSCLALLAYTLLCGTAAVALLADYWQLNIVLSIILVVLAIRFAATLAAVGALFGAWLVWEWPFLGALAFALPGLALGVAILMFNVAAVSIGKVTELLKGDRPT